MVFQVEGRGTARNDANVRHLIYNEFQLLPNVGDVLRLIDGQQLNMLQHMAIIGNAYWLKHGNGIGILSVEYERLAIKRLHDLLEQEGLPHSARSENQHDLLWLHAFLHTLLHCPSNRIHVTEN